MFSTVKPHFQMYVCYFHAAFGMSKVVAMVKAKYALDFVVLRLPNHGFHLDAKRWNLQWMFWKNNNPKIKQTSIFVWKLVFNAGAFLIDASSEQTTTGSKIIVFVRLSAANIKNNLQLASCFPFLQLVAKSVPCEPFRCELRGHGHKRLSRKTTTWQPVTGDRQHRTAATLS